MTDELIKFVVVRTSDAVKKEVSLSMINTKLLDLKRILADDGCFGPEEAPVSRQRIFHLGRELKSGGRSLSNLGLGRFNNRIIHLCIRPNLGDDSTNEMQRGDEDNHTSPSRRDNACGSRKRMRTEGPPTREARLHSDSFLPPSLDSDVSQPLFYAQYESPQQEQALCTNTNLHGFPAGPSFFETSRNNMTRTTNANEIIDLLDSTDDEAEGIEIRS